ATLRADVSQGRSVRQAWSPFLSSDWVGVVKVYEPYAFSSRQLSWSSDLHNIRRPPLIKAVEWHS
ncbi:hypothetical protein P4307_05550, partial [Brevibacillus porteri]|uniref:hypothetical protein n=1 Tax=Brevibacillus porteri TaxID=2126350 RepID=UPI002E1A85CD|nr:hypothetical protein [Brevibacillus porteri]